MRKTIVTCDRCGGSSGMTVHSKQINVAIGDMSIAGADRFKGTLSFDMCGRCQVLLRDFFDPLPEAARNHWGTEGNHHRDHFISVFQSCDGKGNPCFDAVIKDDANDIVGKTSAPTQQDAYEAARTIIDQRHIPLKDQFRQINFYNYLGLDVAILERKTPMKFEYKAIVTESGGVDKLHEVMGLNKTRTINDAHAFIEGYRRLHPLLGKREIDD